MSRPQKIHKPIHAPFNQILQAVALGEGKGKATAKKLAKQANTSRKSAGK